MERENGGGREGGRNRKKRENEKNIAFKGILECMVWSHLCKIINMHEGMCILQRPKKIPKRVEFSEFPINSYILKN